MKRTLCSSVSVLVLLAGTAGAAPSLTGASVAGKAGQTVALPIAFNPASASVASLQFNLTLPKGVKAGDVTPGAILATAAKSVKTNVKGRTWSFIIFGINQNTIPSGDLVTANFKVAPGAGAGSLRVPISGVVYTDPKGTVVASGSNTNGTITVTAP